MRLIDADALIHELNNSHYPGAPYVDAGISIAIGKICDAPTIEPERKRGHWIRNDNGTWSCDQCQSWIPDEQHYYANWCLFCGADMRGGNNGQ